MLFLQNLIFDQQLHQLNFRIFFDYRQFLVSNFHDQNLVFQSNNEKWNVDCDQMFLMNFHDSFEENSPKMISTGLGRTTCSYFMPDNEHILYASTHLTNNNCPIAPLRKEGEYVWPIYDSYDIFISDLDLSLIHI